MAKVLLKGTPKQYAPVPLTLPPMLDLAQDCCRPPSHLDGEGDGGCAAGGGPQQVLAHISIMQHLGGLQRADILEVGVADGAVYDLALSLRSGLCYLLLRQLFLRNHFVVPAHAG